MGVLHGAGTHSRGGTTDAFQGCAWPVGTVGAEPDGGGGIAGDQRTYVPGWRTRHREAEEAGLADRRLAPSLRRAPVAEIERMLGLYRDLYRGFTVKHFHEQLAKRHNYTLGYTVTKLHLHRTGLVQQATQRSAHRKKRPRRPMVGMMLHQDASTHAWLAGDAGKQDLVVTMEDATSEIYSIFLVDEEGTASSFQGIREVVAQHGLFCSLYTDRGSHYFLTPEAGGKVSNRF